MRSYAVQLPYRQNKLLLLHTECTTIYLARRVLCAVLSAKPREHLQIGVGGGLVATLDDEVVEGAAFERLHNQSNNHRGRGVGG